MSTFLTMELNKIFKTDCGRFFTNFFFDTYRIAIKNIYELYFFL
jgi:hypothetical protein